MRVRRRRRLDDIVQRRFVFPVVQELAAPSETRLLARGGRVPAPVPVLDRPLEAEDDVSSETSVEQGGFLRHERHAAFQPSRVEFAEIDPVQGDASGSRDVEPFDEVDDAALASAAGPDERNRLARRDGEVEVRQHETLRSRRVREVYPLQAQKTPARLRSAPRASIFSSLALGGPGVEFRLGGDKLENLLGGAQRGRDGGEHVGDGGETTGELLLVQHKGHERARVEHAVEDEHAAVPEHENRDDHRRGGEAEGVSDDVVRLAAVLSAKLVQALGEILRDVGFARERADRSHASQRLLGHLRRLGQRLLRFFRDGLEILPVHFRNHQRRRERREGHRGQRPRERQHEAQDADHVHRVSQRDVYVQAQRVAHGAAIVIQTTAQVACLVLVEETHVLREHRVEEATTHPRIQARHLHGEDAPAKTREDARRERRGEEHARVPPKRLGVAVDGHRVDEISGEVRHRSRRDGVQHEKQKRHGEKREIRVGETEERGEGTRLGLVASLG